MKDVVIAKNYLTENELKILNNIVSGYFDFAEIKAMNHIPMYMEDYLKHLDQVLGITSSKILKNAGKISHKQAINKAKEEYRKYQDKTLSPVEIDYLEILKKIEKNKDK